MKKEIAEFISMKYHEYCLSGGSLPFVVAIDGRCASGKTTLANWLSVRMQCSVIAMDDFFLRSSQRTERRMKEVGGNVDRERILSEIIPYLKGNQDFSYYPFDCKTMTMKKALSVKMTPIILVEGVYSCHPELVKHWHLTLFIDVDKKKQKQRLLKRNPEKIQEFERKWIPMEEAYFEVYHIQEHCDKCIVFFDDAS